MPALASVRVKRVTDPLHDEAKARLRGYGDHGTTAGHSHSSGGEHQAGDLSGLVRDFFFLPDGEGSGEEEAADHGGGGHLDGEEGLSDGEGRWSFGLVPTAAMIRNLVVQRAASAAEDRFRRDLAADVSGALGAVAGPSRRGGPAAFLRAVMGSLRATGYNAGICESRWEGGGGGLAAGSYEYIDVVTTTLPQQRYIVDVDFAGEFDIARPTAEYASVVAALPGVFVGRAEELRRLLRVLAYAVRRSLRAREMPVPPWRKARYMQAKWLGPYRRAVNPTPSASAAPPPPPASFFRRGPGLAKCRFVGFDPSPAAAAAANTR